MKVRANVDGFGLAPSGARMTRLHSKDPLRRKNACTEPVQIDPNNACARFQVFDIHYAAPQTIGPPFVNGHVWG